jgi:hydrogenase maturation factor
MSSTGTILAALDPQVREKVKATLSKNGFSACFLGEFTESKERVLIKTGKATSFPQVADDPYALILSRK